MADPIQKVESAVNTAEADVAKVETDAKADVAKVESTVKTDVADVKADESKVVAFVKAHKKALAVVAGVIVLLILKHLV